MISEYINGSSQLMGRFLALEFGTEYLAYLNNKIKCMKCTTSSVFIKEPCQSVTTRREAMSL